MAQKGPDPVASAGGSRAALGALLIALAGAAAYVVHLQGRVTELEQRLAAPAAAPAPAPVAKPAAAAPVAPAAAPAVVAPANLFTPEQRQAVVEKLGAETDPGRKAWLLAHPSNSEAVAVMMALQKVFEQAGWATETSRSPYPLKAGIFLMAGDAEPPPFVANVNDALTAGGLEVQYLTGYRDFVAERKSGNPNWVGPELRSDQAFVIVVGGPVKSEGPAGG